MPRASIPDWVVPMSATLTQERFTGPEWIFERKLDGIRLLAFRQGRNVRLFSRNHLPQNHCYPAVVEAIAALPVRDAILDGEATWEPQSRIAYHVFDVIWLDGEDLRSRPLDDRREILRRLPLKAPLGRVAEVKDARPWERACSEGWEGVIAKRRDSRYEHRRSPHWLKMKCESSRVFLVGGYTDPRGGRVGLGALLVGYYDHDQFVFAGKVGTGFDTKLLVALRTRLDALEIPEPAFTRAVGLPRKRAHWVQPKIAVEVAFVEWTVHGKLRHSRLLAVRS